MHLNIKLFFNNFVLHNCIISVFFIAVTFSTSEPQCQQGSSSISLLKKTFLFYLQMIVDSQPLLVMVGNGQPGLIAANNDHPWLAITDHEQLTCMLLNYGTDIPSIPSTPCVSFSQLISQLSVSNIATPVTNGSGVVRHTIVSLF